VPVWAIAAISAAATVVALAGVVAVLALPFLARVDALLTDVEEIIPVVHDVRPEVARIDRNVEHVTPQFGLLRDDLGGFEGALEDVSDPVVRVEAHIVRLVEAIEAVETLPELQEDFHEVAADLSHLRDDFGQVRDDFTHVRSLMEELVAALHTLGGDFRAVVEILEETAGERGQPRPQDGATAPRRRALVGQRGGRDR
jgi:hypothetical protein